MARKGKKEKRRLIFITFTMLIIVALMFGTLYKNFAQIVNNKKEVAVLTDEYEKLLDRQKSLKSEVTKMQDPNYVARYAKEKYLYSQDGEIILRSE
jgi:cell division protein DivIC